MNREIRDQWTAALRSGRYRQGRGTLKNNSGEFCCLGVLCDLAVKDGIIPEPEYRDVYKAFEYGDGALEDDGRSMYSLPVAVQDWADIKSLGQYTTGWDDALHEWGEEALANLNDAHHLTFEQLAEVIEENF